MTVLKPGGVLAANPDPRPRARQPYARSLLASIQAEYGACAVEVLFRDRPQGNVLVICTAPSTAHAAWNPPCPYTDERNRADLDVLRRLISRPTPPARPRTPPARTGRPNR